MQTILMNNITFNFTMRFPIAIDMLFIKKNLPFTNGIFLILTLPVLHSLFSPIKLKTFANFTWSKSDETRT